jgi:thiamine pyrophosphokinase
MTKKFQNSNDKSKKKQSRIVIVANGVLDDWIISKIKKTEYIIGVDRAAYWLIEKNIIPNIAIGDFDSCTTNEYKVITSRVQDVKKFSEKKDKTDLELALDFVIQKHPKEVIIYGAIGSRIDHTIGAIFLLKKLLDRGIFGEILHKTNSIQLSDDVIDFQKNDEYQYLSLLPFSEEIVYDISGCLYNGKDIVVTKGQTRGISNEIQEKKATVYIKKGIAIIIRSRD